MERNTLDINPEEKELLALLRTCGPHDEIRIIVGGNEKELTWTVLMAKNSKKVLIINK